MIVWCVIVGTLLGVFLLRFIVRLCSGEGRPLRSRLPLFEWGREREMFFVPGDSMDDEEDDAD